MTKMLSEILESPRVLTDLYGANEKTLAALCEVLRVRKIHHVVLAGRGTSDHACIYGQYLMAILGGVQAALALPSAVTLYGAQPDLSDTLVIGVSQSGSAADVLGVMEEAKRHGAVVASITNYPDSKMAKAAEYSLLCNAGEETSVAASKTFIAQLGLMYLLCACWFEKPELLEAFTKLPAVISAELTQLQRDAQQITLPYRYMRDGFVLSRGLTYPVALESMLKIQETCYIRMKGYSVSDFYHGPLAQVDSDTPILLYAPKGRAEEDNLAMVQRLIDIGAEPLVITDDAALAEKLPHSYLLPETGCEYTTPFLYAIFAQMFAQSLCAQKGLNPDQPRNLKKVTITK